MSLNQPRPPDTPSLLDRAKQTVSAATNKVAVAKEAIEKQAHHVLPTKLANIALGGHKPHQDDAYLRGPTYPRYKPPSPEGLGLVEPDILSATPTDPDDDDDDDDDDSDEGSTSSWEAIPHRRGPEVNGLPPSQREEKRRRFTENDIYEPNALMADLGSRFTSTCPPQVAEETAVREDRNEAGPRRARGQLEVNRAKGRTTAVAAAQDGHSSSEEFLSCASEGSGGPAGASTGAGRGPVAPTPPYTRSWRHGVGGKVVTVPCGSREELERTYRYRGLGRSRHEPEEFLGRLGAGLSYRPAGAVEASFVGDELSRYRDMGRVFRSGGGGGALGFS